jgi:hypothetical protein
VAKLTLEKRLLKKSRSGLGGRRAAARENCLAHTGEKTTPPLTLWCRCSRSHRRSARQHRREVRGVMSEPILARRLDQNIRATSPGFYASG